MIDIWENTFNIKKIYNKEMYYKSRSWNRQRVQKFLLAYDNERILECMLIIHYNNEQSRDLTIELSNMYNCIVGCQFCASGNLKQSAVELSEYDYIAQINTCLKYSDVDPNNYENFYISFYGIGEPSVVYRRIGNVIPVIKRKFLHAQFNIATFGFNEKCFDYWREFTPDIRTLQIPFYSSNRNTLKKIVRNLPDNYDFVKVLKQAIGYKKYHEKCRVKINYIVIQDCNDNVDEVKKLMEILYPYLSMICIRISYLNYTRIGKRNGYISASTYKIKEIYDLLSSRRFECYIFGTEKNIEVGCGQLLQNHISSEMKKTTIYLDHNIYIECLDNPDFKSNIMETREKGERRIVYSPAHIEEVYKVAKDSNSKYQNKMSDLLKIIDEITKSEEFLPAYGGIYITTEPTRKCYKRVINVDTTE